MDSTVYKMIAILMMLIISGLLMDLPEFSIRSSELLHQAVKLPDSSDSLFLYINAGGPLNADSYLVTYKSSNDKRENLLICSTRFPMIDSIEVQSDGFYLIDHGFQSRNKRFFPLSEIKSLVQYPIYYDNWRGEHLSLSESNKRRNPLRLLLGQAVLITSLIFFGLVMFQTVKRQAT